MFDRLQANPEISLYEVLDTRALCKLYFDMEYDRVLNPDRAAVDGSLCSLLVQYAQAVLKNAHGMELDTSSLWLLDASNDSKFSQHLVVGVVGQQFVGPVHAVGTIAVEIVRQAAAAHPHVFCVHKMGQGMGNVVDLSVYNTNQQFRVPYSSKLGQQRPLLPVNKQVGISLQQCTWPMFEGMLIVCGRQQHSSTCCVMQQKYSAVPAHTFGVCYPLLEAHLNACLTNGQLKTVAVHRDRPLQVPYLYWSTTSRYCPAIGREHTSNHMQIVVDVKKCTWRFHCLDPACDPGQWTAFDAKLLQLHPAAARLQEWHQHWRQHRV